MKEYKDARYAALAERVRERNRIPEGEASFNVLYADYKSRASKLGVTFDLTKEQFRALTSQNCQYCGVEPKQIRNHGKKVYNGHYLHNGIDRVDNDRGYTIDNAVACCGICNKAKRDLSLKDFEEWIQRLVAFQVSK